MASYRCFSCGMERENPQRLQCRRCDMIDAPMQAPALGGEIRNHFNPHFDITQGQYFESIEQKKNWLAAKDKEQVEGNLSPRSSSGGRVICSKTQAKKFIGKNARKIKQGEIPGIRSKRISVSVPN